MSFSEVQTRRRLPLLYLALLPAAALVWLVPHRGLLTDLGVLPILPVFVPLAHVLCAGSHALVTRSVRGGLSLLRSSVAVYGRWGSLTHLHAAILTAVVEEVVFRYAALHGLMDLGLGPFGALLVSATAFAAAHLRHGLSRKALPHYLDALLLGLLLGAVTLASRSLYPAILLHAGRNYILRCLLVSRDEYARLHLKGGGGPG